MQKHSTFYDINDIIIKLKIQIISMNGSNVIVTVNFLTISKVKICD